MSTIRRLAVVASVLALIIAACGKDDGADVRVLGGGGSGSPSGVSECTPVGDASTADATVDVTLDEWSIAAEPGRVVAGSIHFRADNVGAEGHELVVVRAADPAALPTRADGAVDESALSEGVMIGEVVAFPGGSTCDGTFDLTAGDYVLICNLVSAGPGGKPMGHFVEGMATTFTVDSPS